MTTQLDVSDAIAESQRLIEVLEQRRDELPFASDFLAIHRSAHAELTGREESSDQAVSAWRAALARRWECEVSGTRLYKQVYRQLRDLHGGAGTPELQVLASGGAPRVTAAELLADLRRLRAVLEMQSTRLPFAAERLPEIERACLELERAIEDANTREAARREAVLDRRMAQEAYSRLRGVTQRALVEHYGERLDLILDGVFA